MGNSNVRSPEIRTTSTSDAGEKAAKGKKNSPSFTVLTPPDELLIWSGLVVFREGRVIVSPLFTTTLSISRAPSKARFDDAAARLS